MRLARSIAFALAASFALPSVALASEDAHAPEAAAPQKRRITTLESYLMLDPITSTVVTSNRVRGLLVVEIGVDVPDDALRARAEETAPRLIDAYVRALTNLGATAIRPDRAPDVELIAARLQRATDQTLGAQGAKVLLIQVMLRRTR